MPTALFYTLSNVGQYFSLHCSFILCYYVHCLILVSIHCMFVPHTVLSVGFLSLCPLLSSSICPLIVSSSHYTAYLFCVSMNSAIFYNLSTVCQYLTLFCFFSVPICPLLSSRVYLMSLLHTVQLVGSVSL